jgi:hypothetical protein
MSTETANEAKTITADEIVKSIANTKDIEEMRTDLRDLWDNFVIFNDTSDAEDRGNVFCTYKALDNALAAIQQMR